MHESYRPTFDFLLYIVSIHSVSLVLVSVHKYSCRLVLQSAVFLIPNSLIALVQNPHPGIFGIIIMCSHN